MSPEQSVAFDAMARFVKKNHGDLFDIKKEGSAYTWRNSEGHTARIGWAERTAVRRGRDGV
jgi:hypothetical protein